MVNAYPLDVLMMVIVAQVAAALPPVNVRLWKNAAVKMRIAKAWGFSVSRKRTRRCRPPRCDNDTDCEIGTCFEGRCLVDVPCTEACEAGTYCDISARRCVAAPAKSVGCEQKCPEGQRKMLSDPLSMRGDSCCETICECKALPALVPRDVGLHLSARAAAGRILVAAYERHYGDLVLISLDEFGNQLGRVFVDGFDGDQPRHKA